MKISIERRTLLNALGIVKPAASHKSELPVLANVAIGTHDATVDFTCTNMDLYIRAKVEANITGKSDKDKDFTVRVSMLHDLSRSFNGQDVELEPIKNSLRIRCGQSLYKLGTLEADEFPSTPRVSPVAEFKLSQAVLRRLLLATAYCAKTAEDGRPVLCGSLFKVNGDLTAVSCDGRRLAVMSGDMDEKVKPVDVIVPREAIGELLRLLADEDKTVHIGIGEKMIQFKFGTVTLISKIIDGKYPDYGKIIPKLEGEGVPIGRADLLSALRRVSLIGDRCSLDFEGQMLTIHATSEHKDIQGDAVESLLIPKTPKISVRFNAPYLIEALESVEDDEVLFYGQDNSPAVFKVKSNKSWLALTAALTDPKDKKAAAKPAEAKPEEAKK